MPCHFTPQFYISNLVIDNMKFAKKTKAILYGMEFTHGIRRAFMSALALLYFLSFGFNLVSITTLFAISTLIMVLFEFPTGAIADYDSRKKSLMISFILLSIAFFGLFVFDKFWLLAGSWILGDIAWTFSSGANSAWAIDALKYAKEKSKIINLISRGYLFEKSGYVIGGLIGFIIVSISFKLIWLIVSLSNFAMFLIIWKYMEERNFKPTKTPNNFIIKSLIKAKESFSFILHVKNKELKVLLIAGIFSVITVASFFVSVPLLFTEKFGITPEKISAIYAIVGILAIGSPIIAEKMSNKFGFRKSLFSLFILISLSIIIFTFSKSIIITIVILGVLCILLAGSDVIQDSAYHNEFDSKIRASLSSLSSVLFATTSSITIFFTGLGIQFLGLEKILILSGIIGIFTSMICLIGLKKD